MIHNLYDVVKNLKGIAQTEIEREISILNDLNHPRIVKLKESWQNANEVILVMELVSGENILCYVILHYVIHHNVIQY